MPFTKRDLRFLLILLIFFSTNVHAQYFYKPISLPVNINGVNEEYSGMALWKNRLYILPQYGSNKETKLDGDFFIYSISADSISRVIDGKDSTLTSYRTIRVNNLQNLPDSVKKYYQGFEAITIVNGKVFLSIETDETYDYCFLLKGNFDPVTKEINIDAKNFITLNRYPYIENAGFESVTYLPSINKLLAIYEYNAMPCGGVGYLIDPAFKTPIKKISTPFVYFRITDITVAKDNKIYGINYFWNGDYNAYLNNTLERNEEKNIKTAVPDLKVNLDNDTAYLKEKSTCYSRIVSLNNYRDTKWKQVASFECTKNNWEGLALFKKGALVISDANRSSHQITTLAYVAF